MLCRLTQVYLALGFVRTVSGLSKILNYGFFLTLVGDVGWASFLDIWFPF